MPSLSPPRSNREQLIPRSATRTGWTEPFLGLQTRSDNENVTKNRFDALILDHPDREMARILVSSFVVVPHIVQCSEVTADGELCVSVGRAAGSNTHSSGQSSRREIPVLGTPSPNAVSFSDEAGIVVFAGSGSGSLGPKILRGRQRTARMLIGRNHHVFWISRSAHRQNVQ
jgi:hypothetical protein